MILLWLFALPVFLFGFVVLFGAPYVPSLRREVRRAFEELYPLGGNDTLVDLGSGDGVVLLEAARCGAKAYGYEINPILVLVSRLRLGKRATVIMGSMWHAKLPDDTTIVYMFSVSRDSEKSVRYLKAEATRLGKPLAVMMLGAGLKGLPVRANYRGHTLYEVVPGK